ncbi:unnamed protein product [Microthlaspi erraticum]|uniref:Leucine-rich repeat-containing N-terminal plant-type domain-containing protein n=1 Tax=Microthlaspi erraticum TaxID=1685480 RepID=A0A6D2J147_9BRAS|nr:unnamed protein product [Microthlaspi erraticum]
MSPATRNFGFFHHFSFLVFSLFTVVSSDDLQVLLKLKSSLLISNPGVLNSWKLNSGAGPCSFTGITCDSRGNSSVTEIDLSRRGLSGEFPFNSVCELQTLEKLSLGFNSLSGIIPGDLRNCSSSIWISGTISSPNLTYLDASANLLNGDLSELRSLTNLVSLQLFENEFAGEIPPEFGEFKDLVNLSLYTNKLTGPLPQGLGSLADFDFIDASENLLTGPIPPDMCKTGKMKALLLLQNNLTGSIPESYASCLTLERFRVSDNSLNGTVPAGLWGLPKLEIIDLNEQLPRFGHRRYKKREISRNVVSRVQQVFRRAAGGDRRRHISD